MMLFLVYYIFNNDISLTPGIGKSTIPLLPLKSTLDKIISIYPFRAVCLYNLQQMRNRNFWWQSKKNMNVILPSPDSQRCSLTLYNSCNVTMQVISPLFGNN